MLIGCVEGELAGRLIVCVHEVGCGQCGLSIRGNIFSEGVYLEGASVGLTVGLAVGSLVGVLVGAKVGALGMMMEEGREEGRLLL